jgi:hypothetical protein
MWCDKVDNVVTLGRWLSEQGVTANWDAADYWYYFEKPHKWSEEWADLQAELLEDEFAA